MAGCIRCGKTWKSLVQAHCTTCCEQFATDGITKKHWPRIPRGGEDPGGCRHPATVVDKDGTPTFRQDENGVWHLNARHPLASTQ